ncbi:hypothetical protein Bpfe_024387 [Biomphalaria pfeifferi]|uniref:Uncharacterized protein n=1 Tax=Biomphalaria pfeifferi TaxID=112525 RepID=A0AAD8B401_BIOPF|nr:hypothetical protein Bpfe_024387 [Biomphalaria pfeifferi]
MAVQCEAVETYAAYIDKYAEYLKEKCSKLTDCIDKLLTEENQLTIIRGENISLNKTCGLVYRTENSTYTTLKGKCSATEREEIRSDLENNLQNQLDNNRTWKGIDTCLNNLYGNTERTNRVEEICLRARIRKEICNSTNNHRTVEAFFNNEIQSLQCKCKLLTQSAGLKMPVIIGIGVGSFVLLLLIFCLIFCCYRRNRKRKRAQTNRSVVYVAGSSDGQVYQEVLDDKSYNGYRQSPQANPPSLPSRYIQHTPGAQDDGGYLDPVMIGMKYRPMPPIPQQNSNPEYDNPPRYSECDKDDVDNGYFRPLADPVKDVANSSKPSTATADVSGLEQASDRDPTTPLEDAPVPSSVLLGPVPAKRTKKEDRKVESHYYLLEDGAQKDGMETTHLSE